MRRLTGPGPGEAREIDGEIVIGRHGDVALEDDEASRRHAAVRPIEGGVEVEDLGSANGTFVDGERIAGTVTLVRNATLRIGQTELGIEISLPQATRVSGPPAPEVTVARPVQPASPEPSSSPPARARREFPNPRVMLPVIGLTLAAIVVVIVLLVGGGSSKARHPKTVATGPAPQCATNPPKLIDDGFPEPKMLFSHNGSLDVTLKASTATTVVEGKSYPAMAYNGQIPGPMLVICRGDNVRVKLDNGLPLETNLHVHGLHVSPQGAGDDIFVDVKPFEQHQYDYRIPLDQSPGFFWYHPHFHPFVQPEVESGLAGAIIVQGGLDDRLASIPERVIVIQGGREVLGPPIKLPPKIAARLKTPPPAGPPQFIVNGVHDPNLKIQPGAIQRWRLLNATSDRELRLVMPGTTFQLLATDGSTLKDMIPQKQLLIAPSSRVEVLVRGPKAGSYPLISQAFQKCFVDCLDPFAGEGQKGLPDPQETLLTMNSSMNSSGVTVHDSMPTGQLASPGDLRGETVAVHRTLVFARQQDLNIGRLTFPLNGHLFNPNQVDVTMKLGTVEEWTLSNPITKTHNEWHTFHIHQNPFQIISVNAKPLNYIRWEDNVDLPPGSTIVIRMKPIDFVGKFVFHCHLIFHEDNGMMGVVQVLSNPTPAQQHAHTVMYMTPPDQKTLFASANAQHLTGAARQEYIFYCRHLGVAA